MERADAEDGSGRKGSQPAVGIQGRFDSSAERGFCQSHHVVAEPVATRPDIGWAASFNFEAILLK
ncbi:MAG: hypothetical protein NTY30_03145 [Candidatus Berkelbacteria bacterium]|nr:hypothetical protein [Candidatus Berkelbacteria bacterium]